MCVLVVLWPSSPDCMAGKIRATDRGEQKLHSHTETACGNGSKRRNEKRIEDKSAKNYDQNVRLLSVF